MLVRFAQGDASAGLDFSFEAFWMQRIRNSPIGSLSFKTPREIARRRRRGTSGVEQPYREPAIWRQKGGAN